jgi:hypothetical protein
MKRAIPWLLLYLVGSEILEHAVLPPVRAALGPTTAAAADLRLLAMCGLLAGLMVGEVPAVVLALAAAALAGVSQQAGMLGASILAYAPGAYAAGWIGRRIRPQGFVAHAVALWTLLWLEMLVQGLARRIFWPESHLDLPGWGLLATALLGAALLALPPGRLRTRPPIGEAED